LELKLKLSRLKATAADRNNASRIYRCNLQLAEPTKRAQTIYDEYNSVPTIPQRRSHHSPDTQSTPEQWPPEWHLQPGIAASAAVCVPVDTDIWGAAAETL
jgi:hypothetical protein